MVDGKEIERLRTLKGWTQDELGEKVGVSGRFIGYLEKGTRKTDTDKIKLIADELGVLVDDLYKKDSA